VRTGKRRRCACWKEGLKKAGLTPGEMERLPWSDARKVVVARLIWEETTMGMKWIAERLVMRSAANASQQIRRLQKGLQEVPNRPRR
jgi:hypothetical protein